MFSLQQNQRTRGLIRFCQEVGGRGCQTMYMHVSKYKNNKIKKLKLKKKKEDIASGASCSNRTTHKDLSPGFVSLYSATQAFRGHYSQVQGGSATLQCGSRH
jgi:hypothetical protein